MGEADRYSEYKKIKKSPLLGGDNNAVVGLFAINIIFFLLVFFSKVVYYLFESNKSLFDTDIVRYYVLPGNLIALSEQPWSLLSFMFTHADILHLVGNMLWLWAFGYILQELYGNRKLFPLYIYGGLVGGLFFIVSRYFLYGSGTEVYSTHLIGGNASVMSVAVATTLLAPDYRFFRHINRGLPIWALTAIYVVIDLASAFSLGINQCIAHIGGAVAGIVFVILLKKGIDTGDWMPNFYSWFMNLFNPNKLHISQKERVHYNTSGRTPYTKQPSVTQQRIDDILDKINQKGYHFLSEEEKNFLKKASEEDF